MDEQKRPTPERRRLSLTQAALDRPIPKGLELALGMKAWSDNALCARVSLLRRLVGTGWGASAKTLRTAALSLVYSTAEYCALVWCRSVRIRLIDSVFNDALRIVTGCLRPTPSVYLPILSGIQPAELRRQGATLSLANRSYLDPDHILHLAYLKRSCLLLVLEA